MGIEGGICAEGRVHRSLEIREVEPEVMRANFI
jgi:hypothetical protein